MHLAAIASQNAGSPVAEGSTDPQALAAQSGLRRAVSGQRSGTASPILPDSPSAKRPRDASIGRTTDLLSDTFDRIGRKSIRGSSLYDRYTHVKYKSQITYKSYYLKFKQSLVQGGVNSEVENRSNLKNTTFPIMQFQGEDEFKYNESGTLISDQPYFGLYNLYRNEIEDIYPGSYSRTTN